MIRTIREFRADRPAAVLPALLLAALLAAGCGQQGADDVGLNEQTDCSWTGGELPVVPDLEARLDAYVRTELAPDTSHLPESEQAALARLVEAAKIMDTLFAAQATPCRAALEARIAELPTALQPGARRYFAINYGPWDRRFDREPFYGTWEHPEGANFYPRGLTAEEKAAIADPANGLDGLFTMVRRGDDGALRAVPYSRFFRTELERAAALLREAAGLTTNASLRAFLESRADAFLSDDYYASDMLWMDLDSAVEITIGPYETYEDGLFGYKAAFEAFVTVTDPDESARLARFKDELPWLENRLPIPDEHKNPNRGSDSPIRVVDEVYSAGDTRAGIQTIAFNLPNDERVREAKGSKKVLLRNVMKAKFDRILLPIAGELVVREQMDDLTSESFFLHTLWHEMSHGLGPGRITVDGRETEVRLELKEHYSTLEEAKADAMGEWAIFALHAAGRDYFPEDIVAAQAATYLAGLFRSVRFGIGEAHGQANAIQFNYLMEKGAVVWHADTQRFSIDTGVFVPAIEAMVKEICMLQATGDYEGTAAYIERHGGMPAVLETALRKLEDIPVDIEPVFARWED